MRAARRTRIGNFCGGAGGEGHTASSEPPEGRGGSPLQKPHPIPLPSREGLTHTQLLTAPASCLPIFARSAVGETPNRLPLHVGAGEPCPSPGLLRAGRGHGTTSTASFLFGTRRLHRSVHGVPGWLASNSDPLDPCPPTRSPSLDQWRSAARQCGNELFNGSKATFARAALARRSRRPATGALPQPSSSPPETKTVSIRPGSRRA